MFAKATSLTSQCLPLGSIEPESSPPPTPACIRCTPLAHGNSILYPSGFRKTPSDTFTVAQHNTQHSAPQEKPTLGPVAGAHLRQIKRSWGWHIWKPLPRHHTVLLWKACQGQTGRAFEKQRSVDNEPTPVEVINQCSRPSIRTAVITAVLCPGGSQG